MIWRWGKHAQKLFRKIWREIERTTEGTSVSIFRSPYSSDVFLFPRLKIHQQGRRFGTLQNIQTLVTDQLKAILVSEFQNCYEQWKHCLRRYADSQGNYTLKKTMWNSHFNSIKILKKKSISLLYLSTSYYALCERAIDRSLFRGSSRRVQLKRALRSVQDDSGIIMNNAAARHNPVYAFRERRSPDDDDPRREPETCWGRVALLDWTTGKRVSFVRETHDCPTCLLFHLPSCIPWWSTPLSYVVVCPTNIQIYAINRLFQTNHGKLIASPLKKLPISYNAHVPSLRPLLEISFEVLKS